MDKILKIGYQFKAGDLITLLSGLNHLYRTNGVKSEIYQRINMRLHNDQGEEFMMDLETFNSIKPLIEFQECVDKFEIWEGQEVDWDMAKTRDRRLIPLPASDLHYYNFFVYPDLQCDISEPWVSLPPNGNVFNDIVISDHVIINRTERYLNPYITYFFLKGYQDRLIFAGTEKEYKKFCEEWKLDIPRLIVSDFMELAQAIKYCKFLLCNQSACFHLADGIGKARVLEVSSDYPNTLPHGKDGYAFLYQESLEHYFKQLIA